MFKAEWKREKKRKETDSRCRAGRSKQSLTMKYSEMVGVSAILTVTKLFRETNIQSENWSLHSNV